MTLTNLTLRAAGAALACAVCAFAAGGARAQDVVEGQWFIGGQVGYSAPMDGDLVTTKLEFQPGPAIGLVGGYRFNRSFRLEGEFTYKSFDVDTIRVAGTQVADSGSLRTYQYMLNGFADLGRGNIRPYVGGGLGLVSVGFNGVKAGANGISGEETVFAWQLIGGASYQMRPNLMLTMDYRYFQATNPSVRYIGTTQDFETVGNHSLMFGIRYGF